MNNPDRPMTKNQVPKITPEISKFIEAMGVYFEEQGVPRIGGRILGFLIVTRDPISADRLVTSLKVSGGSVSTNLRLLLASGLVEKVSIHGDRTTFYVFSEMAWDKMMETAIQKAGTFHKIVQHGLGALPSGDFARHRLERAAEWTDFAADFYQKALARWQVSRKK